MTSSDLKPICIVLVVGFLKSPSMNPKGEFPERDIGRSFLHNRDPASGSAGALCARPVWELPIWPDEVARVAVWDALQVVLMFWLGLPKGRCRNDFRDDLAGPQARGVHVGDGVFGDAALLVGGEIDGRPIA